MCRRFCEHLKKIEAVVSNLNQFWQVSNIVFVSVENPAFRYTLIYVSITPQQTEWNITRFLKSLQWKIFAIFQPKWLGKSCCKCHWSYIAHLWIKKYGTKCPVDAKYQRLSDVSANVLQDWKVDSFCCRKWDLDVGIVVCECSLAFWWTVIASRVQILTEPDIHLN